MKNFGIEKQEFDKISGVFSEFPEIEEVIIYGSRAKGNAKHSSDLDFSLKGESLNLDLLFEIERQLDDLLMPYKIDISIFKHISNFELKEHIGRIGKSFYLNSIETHK
jgi:predicted nucleotidyltransferase